MKIEVLGTDCYDCLLLHKNVVEAVRQSGRKDVEVEYVDDEKRILRHISLDEVPALLIDGHLMSVGKVPDIATLLEWLRA